MIVEHTHTHTHTLLTRCALFVCGESQVRLPKARSWRKKWEHPSNNTRIDKSVLECDVDFSKKTSTAIRSVECNFLWICCLRMPWSLANTYKGTKWSTSVVFWIFSPPQKRCWHLHQHHSGKLSQWTNHLPKRTAKNRTWRRIKPRCSSDEVMSADRVLEKMVGWCHLSILCVFCFSYYIDWNLEIIHKSWVESSPTHN